MFSNRLTKRYTRNEMTMIWMLAPEVIYIHKEYIKRVEKISI